MWCNLELQLTVYSRLSEEDVHDGNVSLIGIVVGFTLKLSFVSRLVMIGFNHTCKKRVMMRWGYFGQKKIAEKVRESRQNVNRDKSA